MPNNHTRTVPIKSPEEVAVKHSHNSDSVLKNADPSTFSSSEDIINSNNLIKNWVDEKNNKCVMIFPRKLSITWAEDPKYWTWVPNKETPNEPMSVELKNVCWLDITGKFDTMNLTLGITYEVVFKVMLKDPAYGWDMPVNMKLILPNGKQQEQKVSLKEKPRYKWFDIKLGEFVSESGEITFSMYEHEAGIWKKGLFLKGVEVRPKYNN